MSSSVIGLLLSKEQKNTMCRAQVNSCRSSKVGVVLEDQGHGRAVFLGRSPSWDIAKAAGLELLSRLSIGFWH